jgi:hypothetical protein
MDITIPSVWQVTVNCDDGRSERYYFRDRSDVMSSIAITWSKVKEGFLVTEADQVIRVVSKTTGKVEMVATFKTTISVLTGPTHF